MAQAQKKTHICLIWPFLTLFSFFYENLLYFIVFLRKDFYNKYSYNKFSIKKWHKINEKRLYFCHFGHFFIHFLAVKDGKIALSSSQYVKFTQNRRFFSAQSKIFIFSNRKKLFLKNEIFPCYLHGKSRPLQGRLKYVKKKFFFPQMFILITKSWSKERNHDWEKIGKCRTH